METSSKSRREQLASRARDAFREQAGWCAKLGSPFTAFVCSSLAEGLDESTSIGQRVLSWDSDPSSQGDALPLRVCGALHALARSGREPDLAALYPPGVQKEPPPSQDLWCAIRNAMERHPAHFENYLATAPQTNEVGRSAVLICGFLEIARRLDLPVRLFEIGASAGLNLIADRYRYRFGNAMWGDPEAELLLEPQWQGPAPRVDANLRVVGRRGCDIAPLDVSIASERVRLASYVWPDQIDRLSRLESAIRTALRDPPPLDRMQAAEWVEQRLPETFEELGIARVLFHSVVWRYLSTDTQRRIETHIENVGARATSNTPLAWLRFELDESPAGASLTLRLWPSGEETVLAFAQPHGRSITHVGSV